MLRFILVSSLAAVLFCQGSVARAQESVNELKRRIDLLEAKLLLLEQTIDALVAERDQANSMRPSSATPSSATPSSATPSSATPSNPAAAPVAENANDPFRVGVVWVGEAKYADRTARWALSISNRDGDKLTGGVAVVTPNGEKLEFGVTGKAPTTGNGLVVLESELVGRAKTFMRGRLQNGEVALTVSGTSKLGEKFFGAATLRPKN